MEAHIISRLCLTAVLALPVFTINAQERSASGSMDSQVTWTALSTLAKSASDKADMVNTRVDQTVVCGKKGMVYAPGGTGIDSNGCKSATVDMTTVNKIVSCGAQNKIFNGSACVAPTATGFKVSKVTGYQGTAALLVSGWHSFCVSGWSHNDSNFFYGVAAGPNSEGKYQWRVERGWGSKEAYPTLVCID